MAKRVISVPVLAALGVTPDGQKRLLSLRLAVSEASTHWGSVLEGLQAQGLRAPKLVINPNRKIFEARKRETAALGAGEKLVLGHPLAATIGDSARCMQNLEKVLFTGPKTSDTVTFICD